MTILGLQLTTDRLAEVRDFYTRTLQLELVEERDDAFAVQAGLTKLVFTVAEDESQPRYAFGFSVPEARFDETVAELERHVQVKVAEPQASGEGAARPVAYCTDPAENAVSFAARAPLPDDAEPDNPLSLLAVSELTFVVVDVQAVRQLLEARFEFTAFPTASGTRVALRGVDTTFHLIPGGETLLPEGGAEAAAHPITLTLAGTTNAVDRIDDYPYYIQVANVSGSNGGVRVEARPV